MEHLKPVQRVAFRTPSTLLALAALVLLAMTGAVVEDAGNSWSALYLSEYLGASSSVTALGFTGLVAGQLIGWATADRFVGRFGQRRGVRTGGTIIALSMSLAIVTPTVPLTIAGFTAAGFRAAALIAPAFDRPDAIRGLRPGVGLTVVSWLMRFGFLVTPPVVGALPEQTILSTAKMPTHRNHPLLPSFWQAVHTQAQRRSFSSSWGEI